MLNEIFWELTATNLLWSIMLDFSLLTLYFGIKIKADILASCLLRNNSISNSRISPLTLNLCELPLVFSVKVIFNSYMC